MSRVNLLLPLRTEECKTVSCGSYPVISHDNHTSDLIRGASSLRSRAGRSLG